MKVLVFAMLAFLSTGLSAATIQFDYTLLKLDTLGTDFADGRLAFDMDTGDIVQNLAELQPSGHSPTLADFGSQHIDRLEFSDGVTMRYWDYRFDGSLVDSARFSAARNAYVRVEYFEGGSLLLDFRDFLPASTDPRLNPTIPCAILGSCTVHLPATGSVRGGSHVSDPTIGSTYSCAWFGTCHIPVAVNGGITSLVVSYPGATVSTVPVPPAVWLFGSGLLGLAAIARRKQA